MEAISAEDVFEPTEALVRVDATEDAPGTHGTDAPTFPAADLRVDTIFVPEAMLVNPRSEIVHDDVLGDGIDVSVAAFGRERLQDIVASDVRGLSASPRNVGEPWAEELDLRGLDVSRLSGASTWRVAAIDEQPGGDEVVLQRPNGFGLRIRALGDLANQFEPGHALTNVEELLWERGVLRKVRVEFQRNDDVQPLEIPLKIPFLRVHCPKRKGCKAVAETAAATETERTVSMEFLGLGAKGKQLITMRYSRTYPADGVCKKYVVPAKLVVLFGRTVVNGTPVAEGTRFELQPQIHATEEHVLSATEDACRNVREGDDGELIDRRGAEPASSAQTDLEETEMALSGELGAEISFGKIKSKVSFAFTRTSTLKWSLATSLASGAKYLKVPVSDPFGVREICWRTSGGRATRGR